MITRKSSDKYWSKLQIFENPEAFVASCHWISDKSGKKSRKVAKACLMEVNSPFFLQFFFKPHKALIREDFVSCVFGGRAEQHSSCNIETNAAKKSCFSISNQFSDKPLQSKLGGGVGRVCVCLHVHAYPCVCAAPSLSFGLTSPNATVAERVDGLLCMVGRLSLGVWQAVLHRGRRLLVEVVLVRAGWGDHGDVPAAYLS